MSKEELLNELNKVHGILQVPENVVVAKMSDNKLKFYPIVEVKYGTIVGSDSSASFILVIDDKENE